MAFVCQGGWLPKRCCMVCFFVGFTILVVLLSLTYIQTKGHLPLVTTIVSEIVRKNHCPHKVFKSRKIISSENVTKNNCTEKVYNFRPSMTSIFTDKVLMKSCGVFQTNHTESYNMFQKSTMNPVIKTKCGQVKGELLSYYEERKKVDVPPKKVVPNIVHFVSIGHSWEFSFLNYLSVRSADIFIKPQHIFFHGNSIPHGQWWEALMCEVPNIFFVNRSAPEYIQGKRPGWIQHASDIMRLQIITDNGGIYLDTDILVLKSFDPLRQYRVTLGRETPGGLGSGVILGKPKEPFICVWFNVFREYNPIPINWAKYAVFTPHRLSKVLPKYLHIEQNSLHKPAWNEHHLLFKRRIDWSKKYAIHVWKSYGRVPATPEEIEKLSSTLGEVMRYIYQKMTHNS